MCARAFAVITVLLAAACQPKLKSATPASDAVSVPESLAIDPSSLGPAGNIESARMVLASLESIPDIEEHILVREGSGTSERLTRQQLWDELPQERKNVATQILAACQVMKKQTRPDLSTLSATAKFHYGSHLNTEGARCPVTMSRLSESRGRVVQWSPNSSTGSYRVDSESKAVTEYLDPEHQKVLGLSRVELAGRHTLEALRLGEGRRRIFIRGTGTGYVVFAETIGRMELGYRIEELQKENIKNTVIHLKVNARGATHHFTFQTVGNGLKRSLKRAYIGTHEIAANELMDLEKFATRLSLSIN